MSREDMLKQLDMLNRCPKCRSANTQIALTDDDLIRKLNEFKAGKMKK